MKPIQTHPGKPIGMLALARTHTHTQTHVHTWVGMGLGWIGLGCKYQKLPGFAHTWVGMGVVWVVNIRSQHEWQKLTFLLRFESIVVGRCRGSNQKAMTILRLGLELERRDNRARQDNISNDDDDHGKHMRTNRY